jgi:hypothetical protein
MRAFLSNVRLRSSRSVKPKGVSKLPVVKGDLEIVEIECERSAKLHACTKSYKWERVVNL